MTETSAQLTISGVTREVTIRQFAADGPGFVRDLDARFRTGTKQHRTEGTLWMLDENRRPVANPRAGRARVDAIDAEGRSWTLNRTVVVHNRHATIVGFLDSIEEPTVSRWDAKARRAQDS